jgi:hypothetical protein
MATPGDGWEDPSWADGAWADGAWFMQGFTLQPGSYYSEGTQVDENGVVQVEVVANDFSGGVGDIFVLGTRHRADGVMYVTEGTAGGPGDFFVNGIRHTATGVRYVSIDAAGSHAGGEIFISKGFVVNSVGRQYCVTAVDGEVENQILRDDDGSPSDMVVNEVV